jgi:2-methylisocitrate lyase-like PEP mutase family enzyme
VIARAGARAIATSSAAAANALGYADGQHLTRDQMLGAVAAVAGAVDLPVTADMEAGYGDAPDAAAATARGVVEAGAVGLNMEDLRDGGDDLLPIGDFAAKIEAVRAVGDESGIPLVLNARTDVFLGQIGDPATRTERAVERGRAYLESGADCIFVPGVVDLDVITALVQGIDGPVSVLAVPGSPAISDLRALGVARISTGSGPYRAALALARKMAEEAYDAGSLDSMIAAQVAFADAQALFTA